MIRRTKVDRKNIVNVLYVIVIIAVLFSNFFSYRLSCILLLRPDYKFHNETEIHFIDVGQGDAIAIKFDNGKTMLIDTGTEAYRKKLEYYLNNIILDKDRKIDYLVLTYKDVDHSGNMMFILENYEIGAFYRPKIYSLSEDNGSINTSSWYDKIIDYATYLNIPMIFNESGIIISEGFNKLTWLSPIDLEHNDEIDSNDFSPVIKLEYKNHSALFTGDISEDTEDVLLNKYASTDVLDVDILKISHHGSAGSTCEEFLDATSPDFAGVSVGENTYGHPANKLIARILDYDKKTGSNLYSNLYTTNNNGNIIFKLSWNIELNFIYEIDNYSFNSYFTYTLIVTIIILFFMLKPYIMAYKKDLRFVIQNRKFEKYLENNTK